MGLWKKIRHWLVAVVVIIAVVVCLAIVCYVCPPVAAALASAGSWLLAAGGAVASGIAGLAVGAWSWGLAAWSACSFGTFYSFMIGTTILHFNVGSTLLVAALVTTVASMGGWVSLGGSEQSASPTVSPVEPILYEPSYGESSARAMLGADSKKIEAPSAEDDAVVETRKRPQDAAVVAAAIAAAVLAMWGANA